jgi:ABC-type uncharacterized transport system permease subunit
MLEGVQIFCFAASYAVALGLEVARIFFRAPVRIFVSAGFAAAGLLAHTLYLVNEARQVTPGELPLSSWRAWCLLAAWWLAAAYLALTVKRSARTLGLFILPLTFVLIGVASWFPELAAPFPRDQAYRYWSIVHGVALLLGTVVVMLGFVAGLMYLWQSYRLKQKAPPRRGLQLPSLEWLQQMNEDSFVLSTCLLAAGLISGVILNVIRQASADSGLPWSDPVVWTSGLLFAWLAASSLFNFVYKPARQGQKVAYLTVASFVFLGLVLGVVLFSPTSHARSATESEVQSAESGEPEGGRAANIESPEPVGVRGAPSCDSVWLSTLRSELSAHGGAA